MILYTFSKKYAMTGWRLGAAIGPRPVIDIITKLNVNWESCPNHFTQYGALAALTGDQAGPRQMMARLKGRRDAALGSSTPRPASAATRPTTTFYLYPNVTGAVQTAGCADHESFRRLVLRRDRRVVLHAPALRPGAATGETEYYLRLAYSGVSTAQIEEGLGKLKAFLEDTEPTGP